MANITRASIKSKMHKLLTPESAGSYAGMTLMELLAILIILGILAAVALPNFILMKEHVVDQEAIATLQIIQMAEKSFIMDNGNYYPSAGTDTDQTTISQNLKLSLPVNNTIRKWTYTVSNAGCADATRYSGPDSRQWRLRITDTSATPNAACP